jgi:ABC-type dipeptide/oligopeptide/nickel transport system permease subunit
MLAPGAAIFLLLLSYLLLADSLLERAEHSGQV